MVMMKKTDIFYFKFLRVGYLMDNETYINLSNVTHCTRNPKHCLVFLSDGVCIEVSSDDWTMIQTYIDTDRRMGVSIEPISIEYYPE